MTDKEPTQEQIKEFWEWCGIKQESDKSWRDADGIGVLVSTLIPDLDLNNLFKYAVPKVHKEYRANIVVGITADGEWYSHIIGHYNQQIHDWYKKDDDPTLALFWAIWEVIKR